LNKILQEAKEQLEKAKTLAETDEVRVKVLGKKGQLTEILKGMKKLPPDEKKELGQAANKVRNQVETLLEEKFAQVKAAAKEAQ
ncbi:phenylalanine--tRNA ligase subunit alpha, partial [Pseudomonas aeruginosa]|nr:phenylalanine--tRNA ligase subunit alpha [Pseudomonas aeruginosa]